MRTVHQTFRPEFVNRLDAVIVFRPLSRELMRGILTKELARVLEQAPAAASVVRRYRLDDAPLIRDVTHGWRTGRAELVMDGQFDLLADVLQRE